MEQQELEDWFQQEKEKLEKKFYDKLMQGKNTKKAHDTFEAAYKKLIKEYQKKDTKIYTRKQRSDSLKKPVAAWKLFVQDHTPHPSRWGRKWKKAYQKWRLDMKIRHITGRTRKI